jgi:hypothetical protein
MLQLSLHLPLSPCPSVCRAFHCLVKSFLRVILASGLLYISEKIEEHSRVAKVLGQRGIYVSESSFSVGFTKSLQVIILLHILLYFTESFPIRHIAFSIVCHFVYLQNFSPTWPLISLSSIPFIASCILVITDHFTWFFYFSRVSQEARHVAYRGAQARHTEPPGFLDIATFFGLCVWLAPLFLFLSLSANDHALPTSSGANRMSYSLRMPYALTLSQ